jgi:hypothetical protein
MRYYVFTIWFVECQISYLQEGGGPKKQYTMSDDGKNNVYVGYCSNQNRRIIVDFYTGFDFNLLLNAEIRNNKLDKADNLL